MRHWQSLVTSAMLIGMAWPLGAAAQSEGPYISGAVGGVIPRDSDIDGTGINVEAEFDPGYVGAAAIGTTFGSWRAEGEVSYRDADVDDVSGAVNGSGDVSGLGLMVNGFYDFNTGSNWTPYVGAGFGPMRLDVDGAAPIGGSQIDDDDWVLAGQAIGGVGYKFTNRLGMFADYRFLATTDADLTTAAGASVDADYSEHRLMIGLRWSFGGAKAAPKPAPKPAPVAQAAPAPKVAQAPAPKPAPPKPAPDIQREFIVFFDWDRAVLTDDARAIVQAAAKFSEQGPVTVIKATGHADTSGTDRYNLGLSKRRAAAVQAELVRLGISVDDIFINWKGEREPLVETDDGVREPQNRRVEIVLQK